MISKRTKYGFKALIYLAQRDKNTLISIEEISKSEHISKKFLEGILLDLKKHGLLGSKMGKGGGYYLKREAADIHLSFVYRVLEGPIALLPCVSLNYYEKCEDCKDESGCILRHIMIEVRNSMLKTLEHKTLGDFIDSDALSGQSNSFLS